jgi:hypothetical protein
MNLLQASWDYWIAFDRDMHERGLVPVIESWWSGRGASVSANDKQSRLIWSYPSSRARCQGAPDGTHWESIEDRMPFATWLAGRYKQRLDIEVRVSPPD